jgi:hypothetical protein
MSPSFAARGPRASLRPWYLVGDSFTNNRRRSPSTNAYSPRTPFPGRTTSRGERVRKPTEILHPSNRLRRGYYFRTVRKAPGNAIDLSPLLSWHAVCSCPASNGDTEGWSSQRECWMTALFENGPHPWICFAQLSGLTNRFERTRILRMGHTCPG